MRARVGMERSERGGAGKGSGGATTGRSTTLSTVTWTLHYQVIYFFCLLSSTKTICRWRGVLQFALMVFLSLRGHVCLGLKICQGRSNVIWHLIGMGTAPEIHSVQFQDHSLEVKHCDTTMRHNLDNVFSPKPWDGRFLCFFWILLGVVAPQGHCGGDTHDIHHCRNESCECGPLHDQLSDTRSPSW